MKHTPESLAAMSDFERSKALSELLGWDVLSCNQLTSDVVVRKSPIDRPCSFDCNNPSDVMPLVFENKLSMEYVVYRDSGYWFVGANTYLSFDDDNPLRAAACCLILVLQEKKQ